MLSEAKHLELNERDPSVAKSASSHRPDTCTCASAGVSFGRVAHFDFS